MPGYDEGGAVALSGHLNTLLFEDPNGSEQETHPCPEVMGKSTQVSAQAHTFFEVHLTVGSKQILHTAVRIKTGPQARPRAALSVDLAIEL